VWGPFLLLPKGGDALSSAHNALVSTTFLLHFLTPHARLWKELLLYDLFLGEVGILFVLLAMDRKILI